MQIVECSFTFIDLLTTECCQLSDRPQTNGVNTTQDFEILLHQGTQASKLCSVAYQMGV